MKQHPYTFIQAAPMQRAIMADALASYQNAASGATDAAANAVDARDTAVAWKGDELACSMAGKPASTWRNVVDAILLLLGGIGALALLYVSQIVQLPGA